MRVGDIFRKSFSFKKTTITLDDIQNSLKKSPKYNSYASSIVSKRGNIFKNKSIDIDKIVDDSLKKPLASL